MIASCLVCLKLVCLHNAVHFGQEAPHKSNLYMVFLQGFDTTIDKCFLVTSYSLEVLNVSVLTSLFLAVLVHWLNIHCKNQDVSVPLSFSSSYFSLETKSF